MEICKFKSTKSESCLALSHTKCSGYDEECKFYKTEQQYIDAANHAIELNRAKGNCDNCRYVKVPCELQGSAPCRFGGLE